MVILEAIIVYEAKNFEYLLGAEGLSDKLLKNHFSLYQGYVNNTNKLHEALVRLEKDGKLETQEYAELKRRFGWEFNGMRLHEYYFENLTKEPQKIDTSSGLFKAITNEFGSYDFWKKDFKSMGLMRGIGWVILYLDQNAKRLFNVWINEHDVGHLAGATPLLVMDVFEHAYMLDYGLKKADYIETFFNLINWNIVHERYEKSQRD